MAFGTAYKLTNVGTAITAKRMVGATPSQAEPKFLAIGVGATGAARTAADADTALSTEVETRTTCSTSTITTTLTNDTFQAVGTVTATAGRSVDEAGLFDIVTSSTGNLYLSATFPVVGLLVGDSVAITAKVQYLPS